MKKLSKILSILLMVALIVTINFDVYAKARSGGFKSSGSHKSSSSSSKSSSSSSSGGFKSSSDYSKPSTTTKKPSTSTSTNKSTGTSNVNKGSNNNRSFIPMIFYGNSFLGSMFRNVGILIIIIIIFFAIKWVKRKK